MLVDNILSNLKNFNTKYKKITLYALVTYDPNEKLQKNFCLNFYYTVAWLPSKIYS